MKKLLFSLILLLALVRSFPTFAATSTPPLIVIDPGHGGIDPGTVNGSLKEKEINLKVAQYLKQFLEQAGALVTLTREMDMDLAKLYPGPGNRHFKDVLNRKLYIDNLHPDLFVSIHVNSGKHRKQNFAEVFYGRNPKSLAKAEIIQKSLNEIYNVTKYPQMADYLILSASTPGLLIEIGFIDDPKLTDDKFLNKLAKSIAQAMITSLKEKNKEFVLKAKLLIVIDDFGNNSSDWQEFLKLNIPFTAAIMPFLENTQEEAKSMVQANKDIIIHLPLEPKKYKRSWLGPKPIMVNLSEDAITDILNKALKENPQATGINNHTGSKACENEKVVRTILNFCQKHNLIYIDSQTTANSLFPILGSEYGVAVLKRDIFLEVNGKNEKAILKQLFLLEKIATKKGLGIAIGHVGYEGGLPTANALKAAITPLQAHGIKFCSLKEFVKKHP